MLCPYCLKKTNNSSKCKHCEEELPPLYRKGYSWRRQPAILSTIGFSGHGKTVYLASLLHTLDRQLTQIWPGFYRQGLDQNSINTVKKNRELLEQGKLPESTRRSFPCPSIHRLVKMPKHKERQIIIYDPPGEAFEEDLSMEEYASFVKQAKTVLFLISLDNLDKPLDSNMHRLLNVYTLGMERLKARTDKQHLVVVFTKADLLHEYFEEQPSLIEYLEDGQQYNIKNINQYLSQMNSMSAMLKNFTINQLDARSFVNLAEDNFKSVSYCAISALGQAPEGATLAEAMQPKRVIDPLLWVLEKA